MPTHEAVLKALRSSSGRYISGAQLAARLGISRAAIWNHIQTLRNAGYSVEAHPNRGYLLHSVPDKLLSDEIKLSLNTKTIGQTIYTYEETASTSDVAGRLAKAGAPEGTVIFAEHQSRGRGRLGRSWFSLPGKGILMSLILRPAVPPGEISQVTLVGAVAVAKSLKKVSGLTSLIKWPNDIMIDDKKVCGILTEMETETDIIEYIVLGIGINVNLDKKDFPRALRESTTSLKIATGKEHSRIALAKMLLASLEHYYAFLQQGTIEPVLAEWTRLSYVTGKMVEVHFMGNVLQGQAVGVDSDGVLLIRRAHGTIERISGGDLKILD